MYYNRLSESLVTIFNPSIHLELATIQLDNNRLNVSVPEVISKLSKLTKFE